MTRPFENLPDPAMQPEFYADITLKRFLAWIVDAVIITVMTIVSVLMTAFTAILIIGFVTLTISLLYRWLTIASGSATPGMRFMGMELRNARGEKLTSVEAFWHSALFLFFKGMIIPQLVSIAMMLTTERGQGLHDALCGVVGINKRAGGELLRS